VIAEADGAGERRLTPLKKPEGFYRWPTWSPDGKLLTAVTTIGADRSMRLTGVRVADGTIEVLNANTWDVIDDAEWLPDGSGLIVSAREMGNSLAKALQLWRLDYPGGKVSQITNDLSNYFGVSLTADGRALVTIQSEQRSYLWVVPGDGAGVAEQVTSGREYVNYGVAWAPEGRIIYPAAEGTNMKLWSVNAGASTNCHSVTLVSVGLLTRATLPRADSLQAAAQKLGLRSLAEFGG
jgi:Tol biopolymer transport system component